MFSDGRQGVARDQRWLALLPTNFVGAGGLQKIGAHHEQWNRACGQERQHFEQRAPVWVANAATLGIDPTTAVNLLALTGSARDAYNAAQIAQQNSLGATAAQDASIGDMRSLGGDLIKGIRLKAEMDGDPALFALALLPTPKDPEPIPAVPASTLSWTLLTSGDLDLKWEGNLSSGTTYIVERSLIPVDGPPTAFEAIGFVGALTFTDKTVPPGTAMRSTRSRGKRAASTPTPAPRRSFASPRARTTRAPRAGRAARPRRKGPRMWCSPHGPGGDAGPCFLISGGARRR